MKTKEELNEIKRELEAVSEKVRELSDEELEQVVGGDLDEKFVIGVRLIGTIIQDRNRKGLGIDLGTTDSMGNTF